MSELDIRSLMWDYFDKDALREPEYILRSLDSTDMRWYWEVIDDKIKWYISMTELIGSQLPKDKYLTQWMLNNFNDVGEHQDYMQGRADEGNALHDVFLALCINRSVDLDEMPRPYRDDGSMFNDRHFNKLKHDLIGLAQFLIDHKVNPLAVEIMVRRDDGIAGRVDLICNMTIEEKGHWGEVYKSGKKKGKPKETKREREIVAIIDLKSRDNGNVYESDVVQVNGYIPAVEQSLDIKPERAYVLMPSQWRTNPGYNLRDVTDRVEKDKLPQLLENFMIDNPEFRPSESTEYKGVIDIDKGTVDGNLRTTELEKDLMDFHENGPKETVPTDSEPLGEPSGGNAHDSIFQFDEEE